MFRDASFYYKYITFFLRGRGSLLVVGYGIFTSCLLCTVLRALPAVTKVDG